MGKFLAVASFYNNSDEHIQQTFDNVLNQTHQDWLLVVGDDFSSDETFRRRLKRKVEELDDKRILYYPTQFKRELYLYQNTFQHYDYDYYFDLDADDIIDPNLFAIYDAHFQKYPQVSSIFCDFMQVKESGELEQWSVVQPADNYEEEWQFRHNGEFWQIYQERNSQKMFGVARAMRKPTDASLPIVEPCKTATDTYFLFYNLTRGTHLHIPRNLYTYIRRPGSDSGVMSDEEHEKFNLNASQFMGIQDDWQWGAERVYDDLWHVTSAISTTEWLSRVNEFSIVSEELNEDQQDRIKQLYPDKTITFNQPHRNIVVAWHGELNEQHLAFIKTTKKCSVLMFNDDFASEANGDTFKEMHNQHHAQIKDYLGAYISYNFFRQTRFTVDDELDETVTTPRKAIILVDTIESAEQVDSLVKNVFEINASGSEAHLVELRPTLHQHHLKKVLGAHYYIPNPDDLTESLRTFIETQQPDLLYWDADETDLSDSTKYWLNNNYWVPVDADKWHDFSEICLRTPIPEVPKCKFYYRSAPELRCDWAPDGWIAEFRKGPELVWTSDIPDNGWLRYGEDHYQEWECWVVHKRTGRVAYKLKPDCTRFGVQIDSGSLGDTLSWMGQIEELMQQRDHERISVRCAKNWLFDREYYKSIGIDILEWSDTWAHNWQNLGVYIEEDKVSPRHKHPRDWRTIPLGAIAADQLGISYVEKRPRLAPELYQTKPVEHPAVCIATESTAQAKYWNRPGGWQTLVDNFNAAGWKVYYVSKEETKLNGVEHIEDLIEAAQHIKSVNKFIGISSGLSWLAWALDVDVCLISGFTWEFVEFECDVRIINHNVCSGCWTWAVFDRGDWYWCPQNKNSSRHFECTKTISPEYVWQELETAGWFNI